MPTESNMKMNLENIGFEEATENWKKFHWLLQILVVAVGLIVVLSLSFVLIRGVNIYQRYFPLVNASMAMRLEATTSYLWFEEMIGGDETKSLSDILKQLDLADWYANAMIEGGENSSLKLLPLNETVLYSRIGVLQKQLIRQREILIKRNIIKDDSGPGSEIDNRYHSMLEAFISNASLLEMQVNSLIEKEFRTFTYIGVSVIIFCMFLFLIVGYSFYRYENLRRKNYSEILDMHEILIQKEKMAFLGTMMAGIAHEINNPNTFISLNIPILRNYLKDILLFFDKIDENDVDYNVLNTSYKKIKKDLSKIMQNIENGSIRINRIVSTLKNFSRSKNETKMSWFNIRDTIFSVTDICSSKIEFLAGSFEVNIAECVPEKIFFNPETLEICLINLLNNATEAVDKQISWVKLYVFLNSKNGIVIEVKDNGNGIKESDMQRIFEPFFSTKSSRGGTGLGLYLCQLMLHQIGAFIEVDSEVGVGSEFRLVLNGRQTSMLNADS